MPDWEAYAEADRRGILPPDKRDLYQEAIKRGLVPGLGSGEKLSAETERSLSLESQEGILKYTEPTIEVLGMAGGAALGSLGGPAGALLGGGGGYAAGRQVNRAIREYMGMQPQAQPMERVSEAIRDIPMGAALQGGGELIGRGVGTIAGKLAAPHATLVEQPAAQYLKDISTRHGIELTPADITGSTTLGQFESLAAKLWGSAEKLRDNRLESIRQLMSKKASFEGSGAGSREIENLGEQIKGQVNSYIKSQGITQTQELNLARNLMLRKLGSNESYESLGRQALESLTTKSQKVREIAQQKYADLKDYIPEGTKMPLDNLRKTAESLYKQQKSKPPGWKDSELMDKLKAFVKTKEDDEAAQLIANMSPEVAAMNPELVTATKPKGLTWDAAQSIRSDLNKLIVQEDIGFKSQAPGMAGLGTKSGGAYKQMKIALDKDMEAFAQEQGGELWDQFQLANAFYKNEYKSVYDNAVIRKYVKTDPNIIVDRLMSPKSFYETQIVKDAIGTDKFNQTIKPGITNKLFDTGDVFDPNILQRNLDKIGPQQLSKVYTPQEISQLRDIAKKGIDVANREIAAPFLEQIAKSDVNTIMSQIVLNPKAKFTVRNVELIKNVVDKPTFDKMRTYMAEKMFEPNIHGLLPPQTFALRVKNYGDPLLSKFYNPEELRALHEIRDISAAMQTAERTAGNPSGTGQTILTWGQAGLVFYHPAVGIPALIAPPVAAKMYLSKTGREYLLRGMRTPVFAPESAKVASRLSGVLATEKGNEE